MFHIICYHYKIIGQSSTSYQQVKVINRGSPTFEFNLLLCITSDGRRKRNYRNISNKLIQHLLVEMLTA